MTAILIDKKQIKQLQTVISKTYPSREERLEFLSNFLGREITTTKDLSSIEAVEVIYFLNKGKVKPNSHWGYFDIQNSQHRNVLSLMRQANWTVPNENHGEVPDLERLSNFLKSPKSPVNKPLKQMKPTEVSKLIVALEGIVKHTYSK